MSGKGVREPKRAYACITWLCRGVRRRRGSHQESEGITGNGRYVYRYLFRQTDDLKIKHFAALDQEWLEFIKENRTKGGIQHAYDVVVGPVADDNTMETVQLYLSGILKAEEAVERLRYNKVNNQVSFHTPLALEHLTLESRKEVS